MAAVTKKHLCLIPVKTTVLTLHVLKLCLVARGEQREAMQLSEGVEAIAGLGEGIGRWLGVGGELEIVEVDVASAVERAGSDD